MKRFISGFIRVLVSVTLMGILIYVMRGSLQGMLMSLKQASFCLCALAAAVYIFSIVIASLRLRVFLRLQGIEITLLNVFRVNLIGYFFSSFLPTSIGGDIVKAMYISRKSGKNTQSYTSVFIDRFVGMFTIFLIAMAAIFAVKDTSGLHLIWLLPILIGFSLVFILLLCNKELAKKLLPLVSFAIPARFQHNMRNIYNAMHSYRHHGREIADCFMLSLIAQGLAFSAVYFLALGIKSYIALKIILLVMPVASIVSMLPSINGMGPREMSIVMMLKPFIGAGAAGAIAFLWLGLLLVTSIIGGAVYMFVGHQKIDIANL